MREILFRGKRFDNGEWIEGNYRAVRNSRFLYIERIDKPTDCYRVDPKTVGQYIGLTDKNGKKIFEGDIVKTNTDICVIVWQGSRFIAKKTNKRPMTLQYIKFSGEVIGNIYDNPELLKGAN